MQCTSDVCRIIFTIVFPTFGCILGIMVFLSPLPAVLNAVKNNRLGSVNPLPYAMIFGNCIAWFIYALVIKNYYVLIGNMPGILLSLYYMIAAYAIGYAEVKQLEQQQLLEATTGDEREVAEKKMKYLRSFLDPALALMIILVFILEIVSLLIFVTLFPSNPSEYPTLIQKNLIGITCVIILVLFYTSPLSTLVLVIKQRDCSSIDWRLSLTCFFNGGFWAVYGIVIGDGFIWGPNLVGAILAVVQLICICLFPPRLRIESNSEVRLNSVVNS